ncbi:arginine decarboxylase, pyruvoyl-dependent [Candidatus Bipolaricaulota bacterium]|nr:arginine decarboxylase, pyruvoyl-dependent [Candidatus Bipolaricaulota bacterium]
MGFAEVKRVVLVSGAAEGETELNAFDNALLAAGIGDLNLIKVTSILPPHVEVVDEVPELPRGAFVPIVYTSVCSDVSGERIAAAVGIGRASDGFGVVMEASGHSQEEVEAEVRKKVEEAFRVRSLELTFFKVTSVEHVVRRRGCVVAACLFF